jgi:hypothetical protein
MKKEYTISTTLLGTTVISYTENNMVYSFNADPANSDYQEYLKSLEESSN